MLSPVHRATEREAEAQRRDNRSISRPPADDRMATMFDFCTNRLPCSPVPPVDHRSRRAAAIAADDCKNCHEDDRLTLDTAAFLRAQAAVTSEEALLRLRTDYPDIYGANQLAHGPPRLVLELQGRLLAGQTAAQIAEIMGLQAAEVETYTALYYDVPERLDASIYICRQAIGLELEGSPSQELLVLICAWRHGPHALDAWLDFLDRQHDPSLPRPPEGSLAWRNDLAIELLIGVQQMKVDSKNNRRVVKFLHASLEMIAQRDGPRAIGDLLMGGLLRQRKHLSGRGEPTGGEDIPVAAAASHVA